MNPEFEWIESADSTLSDHFKTFEQLVSCAEFHYNKSDFESAATFCKIAAEYAWRNHAGLFFSPRLEELLQSVSQKALKPAARTNRKLSLNQPINRVLHIITEAYSIGGHTRMVWRWIKSDPARAHSVFLTRQGTHEVPKALLQASRLSGGKLYSADSNMGGLIHRAGVLHRLARRFDAIVLHVHPYDVLPIIGLPREHDRPPVVFMNHADHVFWLGVSISDLFAHFRHSGLRLSTTRRAIERGRSLILPIPINPADRKITQSEAKRILNLSEKDVVLLSIASSYKYKGRNTINFLEATAPIIHKCSNAVLLIVGPDTNDLPHAKDPAIARRIHLFGRRDDNLLFYQAADIYIDSLPFASITSLLEAGSFGLPLVSYCSHPRSCEVLCADDPGLIRSLLCVTDTQTYQETVSGLISSTEFRKCLGHQTREEICAIHGRLWPEHLENLYARALLAQPWKMLQSHTDQLYQTELDERLLRFHRDWGIARKVRTIVRSHYLLLPLRNRFKIWARTIENLADCIPGFLFPEWFSTLIKYLAIHVVRRCKI